MKRTTHILQKSILLLGILHHAALPAVSMVYNFRIAQVTKQPIFDAKNRQNHTVMALLFDVYQKKYCNDIAQNFAGGLASYIYDFKPYYFRIDGAVSAIDATQNNSTTFSGAETDDLLFTLGHNFHYHNHITTLSGLFGVPTHAITGLRHASFGYSQMGLGLQLDGSLAMNQVDTFFYGLRYIYFAPRAACDNACKQYIFTIGNIADILMSLQHKWHSHSLESGYTQRWDFGAHSAPFLEDLEERTNYVRSSFYLVYKYSFLLHNLKNRLLFNISYGFDQKPKRFGNKYIVTLWGSWNINF